MKKYVIAAAFAVINFLSVIFQPLGSANKNIEDFLYHNPQSADNRIRIIKIDDKTMNKLGDFNKIERSVYSELIEILNVSEDVKPAVIGFDIIFSEQKDVQSDIKFAETCGKFGNVICAFNYVFENEITENSEKNYLNSSLKATEKNVPYEELAENVGQGFVNAIMDKDDGFIRDCMLYFDENGQKSKSFPSVIYEFYQNLCKEDIVYPSEKNIMKIKYSVAPGGFENVSIIDVLEGKIPPEAFDDCIVLVGVYSAGMMDSYFVPVEHNSQMFGVEIHANIIQALLEQKTLTAFPKLFDAVLSSIFVGIIVLLYEKLSVSKVWLLCGISAAAKLILGKFLFEIGFTWEHLTSVILLISAALFFTAKHYYNARSAKQNIEKVFKQYVAPQIVKEIADSGKYQLKLGGETRNIAVMFIDIRGFTPLSESLEAEKVVDILNGYLELVTRCIFRHGGTLDKFIGDAAMAIYNAPFDTENYVYKAVLTAWDIVCGGNKIETEYLQRYGKNIGFGVGINCGEAVVGNIGCEFRMDYTAIGDTVNTAARLEANAPKSTIYISQDVYEAVKDKILVEEIGEIPLKGKSKGVFVYKVTKILNYISPEGEL